MSRACTVTRSYFVRTFGCQMNEHDSERIAGLARGRRAGAAVDVEADADVVVLNTCCIRENADNKLYGTLGHLKPWKAAARRSPDRRRRAAWRRRTATSSASEAPYVDVVLGTHNVHRAAELLDDGSRRTAPITEILDEAVLDDQAMFPSALPARRETTYNAWVTIQIGCDNSCAFCIVPAVRGARSAGRSPTSSPRSHGSPPRASPR